MGVPAPDPNEVKTDEHQALGAPTGDETTGDIPAVEDAGGTDAAPTETPEDPNAETAEEVQADGGAPGRPASDLPPDGDEA